MLHKLYTSTARSLRVVIIISTSVFSAGVNLVSVAVDSEDVPVVPALTMEFGGEDEEPPVLIDAANNDAGGPGLLDIFLSSQTHMPVQI